MAKARNPRGMPSPELLETCNTLHRSTRNLLIQIFPRDFPLPPKSLAVTCASSHRYSQMLDPILRRWSRTPSDTGSIRALVAIQAMLDHASSFFLP